MIAEEKPDEQPASEPTRRTGVAALLSPEDESVRAIFHELWGQAQEQPGYDKRRWEQLQLMLNDRGVFV